MKPHRLILVPALLAALAGCGSIGEGSTIESLEILPANGSAETAPYTMYQCLRDQLVVIATFSDGTRADFSFRANWTSSDPAIVQVSNNDVPSVFVIDGVFTPLANVPYRPGTLIPAGGTGTATITASFIGLHASMNVAVSAAPLSIAPVGPGIDPQAPPAVTYVGENTTQRFTFFAQQGNRLTTLATINALGNLTPVLWRFPDAEGELDVGEDGVTGDFDKYAAPTAADPSAVIHTTSGVVTGKKADAAQYTVQAVTDLCPTVTLTAPIRVAGFTAGTPITLAHEEDFNGDGVAPTGDFISGTSEVLRATANLDLDADGVTDATQDLAGQVALKFTHTTACTAGEPLCICDGANCRKNIFTATGQNVFTVNSTGSGAATVLACLSDVDDQIHTDDCDETETGATKLESNTLALNAVPVDLTTGSFQLVAPTPAAEPAFTYPGAAFHAYGTFTALSGSTFSGGAAQGTQKLTRLVGWNTREQGSTTELSDVAFVRRSSDGLFNDPGQMAYSDDVSTNTGVDVSFTAPTLFSAITTLPAPVTFTICPSGSGTCP